MGYTWDVALDVPDQELSLVIMENALRSTQHLLAIVHYHLSMGSTAIKVRGAFIHVVCMCIDSHDDLNTCDIARSDYLTLKIGTFKTVSIPES